MILRTDPAWPELMAITKFRWAIGTTIVMVGLLLLTLWMLDALPFRGNDVRMSNQEVLVRLEAIRADAASRAQRGRSGYINPTPEDMAREEGARSAYEDIEASVAALIADIRASR